MSTRVHSLTINDANFQMFPNAFKFNATDVFLGAGFIEKVVFLPTTVANNLTLDFYDGIMPPAAATPAGLVVVGGTIGGGTQADLDRFRIISGAPVIGTLGEIHDASTPNAQLTNCRKVIAGLQVAIPAIAAGAPQVVVPIEQWFAGMAINIIGGASSLTIDIHYTPSTSGSARRRLYYGKDLTNTVKLRPSSTALNPVGLGGPVPGGWSPSS